MDEQAAGKLRSDEVQVFDIAEALKRRDHRRGRVDMAIHPTAILRFFRLLLAEGRPISISIPTPIRSLRITG